VNDPHDTAAKALAKCAAYDPWFPQPNRATVQAWAEQINRYGLDLPDVLAGVTKMYSDNGSGFRPLPRDLIDASRAVRKDRTDRAVDRSAHEALCDTKAGDLTPVELAANRRVIDAMVADIGKPVPDA
jgi:hypothetical protein